MSEHITDEAVTAAANAISECSGMRFDGFWSRVEDLEPEDREYALMEARAALEAAAPHMLAEASAVALEEAADELAKESPFHDYADTKAHWRIGHKWAHILRARSAAVRSAK